MKDNLEVIIGERKNFRNKEYAIVVSGPEPDDLWCAEPKPDAGYRTEMQKIFYLQKMNECYLLTRENPYHAPQPQIFDATTNEKIAHIRLYEAALTYAKGLQHEGSKLIDDINSKKAIE